VTSFVRVLSRLRAMAVMVLPWLSGPGVTAGDALGLWPAAMILLLAAALVGALLTVLRLVGRRRWGRVSACTSSASTSLGESGSPPA
jgi:hypothetical protein